MKARTLAMCLVAVAGVGTGGCDLILGIDDPKHEACGDGAIEGGEACDDGNTTSGDGCSATCEIEHGYTCTGQPSACATTCGDGIVAGDEACDDGNTRSGDGCDDRCAVESGFSCAGMPSVCQPLCGNGAIDPGEQCDDGNDKSGDGCDDHCKIESGFACTGVPSACAPICGDGIIAGTETCDDGNDKSGDGCDAECHTEHGFTCTGTPSSCASTCGDGIVASDEQCDDMNTQAGDGCSPSCHVEHGYTCAGEPSVCVTTCGDGVLAPDEQCDDGNTMNGDGCDAACQIEPGWTCDGGQPTVCTSICGDGLVVGHEGCDDGHTVNGDGCSSTCQVETGYHCAGQPSVCAPICGDGLILPGEQCDDGNTNNGDCCSSTCQVEPTCLFEVEPNNSLAQADARAADPVPLEVTSSARIKADILPIGDLDYFALSTGAAADTVVRFETFDGSGIDCTTIDTFLYVYQQGTATPIYSDNDDGIGNCSALTVNLGAGNFYVRVNQNGDNALIPAYLLDVKFQPPTPGTGVEIEPNDTPGTATAFVGTDAYILGHHQTASDIDYFTITVPPGANRGVRAEIIEGNAEACELDGIASRLTLYKLDSVMGYVQIADDNAGGGRGLCSLIDGTGTSPLTPGAGDLPPGTYYLEVRAASTASGLAAQFDYRLSVVIR